MSVPTYACNIPSSCMSSGERTMGVRTTTNVRQNRQIFNTGMDSINRIFTENNSKNCVFLQMYSKQLRNINANTVALRLFVSYAFIICYTVVLYINLLFSL